MSDSCPTCPIESECHYAYKPCECAGQRKYWDLDRRVQHERERGRTYVIKKVEKPYLATIDGILVERT